MKNNDWKSLISKFGYGYIDDKEQYKIIVKTKAYTDMQPRTIKGLAEFRKNKVNNDKLNDLFDEIAEELHSFVIIKNKKENQKDFDKWHKNICEKFTNEFNEIIDGKGVDKISFGKAQKIINISLKYIYCLKDAEKYVDKFKHCHMTLDRYTYSEGFYKEKVVEWCKNNLNEDKNLQKNNIKPWSNLGNKEYIKIQDRIRQYLESAESEYKTEKGKHLTPFQAEFYIFDEYNKSYIND